MKHIYSKKLQKIQLTPQQRQEKNRLFGQTQCSFAKDKDGYFCYTHRARSSSYKTISKIPKGKVDFISSTSASDSIIKTAQFPGFNWNTGKPEKYNEQTEQWEDVQDDQQSEDDEQQQKPYTPKWPVFVFDFDGTIIRQKQKVYPGDDYYTNTKYLDQWSEWHNPGPKFNDIIAISNKYKTYILTARDNDDKIRKSIYGFLNKIGAKVQLGNIVMLGSQQLRKKYPKQQISFEQMFKGKSANHKIDTKLAQLKAQYLQSMIKDGIQDIIFYDDHDYNIQAAKKVKNVTTIKV